jgi:hypothetical protein
MMFETTIDGEGFQAKRLSNGIHEFRWHSTERAAVDLWMEYNDLLYGNTEPNKTLCFLHVIESVRFPPISYVVRKAQHLQTKYPQQPNTRSAVLFQSRFFGGFINTLQQLLNRKGKDVTRIFTLKERDKAIEWLLGEDV